LNSGLAIGTLWQSRRILRLNSDIENLKHATRASQYRTRYHASQQIASYSITLWKRRTILIRATPLSEGPQSAASRLIARPERSTQIL
jgi:hypothetical protein